MDFGAAWPAARAQVAAVLRARGVQAPDVDDIAQEVAVRALRASRPFESDEHFVAWCCRVAINLHIDATRREQHLSYEPPPDAEARHDTAATAERRMALDLLTDRIAELPEQDRRLLFEATSAGSRQEAVRLAVRRHRLRARLAALVEGLVAAVPFVRRLHFPSHLSRPVKLSLAAAPVIAAGLMLEPFTAGPGSPVAGGARSSFPARTLAPPSKPAAHAERSRPGLIPPAAPTVHEATRPTPTTVGAGTSKVIVGVRPAGVPVQVSRDDQPVSRGELVCTGGLVNLPCVPKPDLIPPGA